jgi:type IV pilus assembly protein PilM
MVDWKKDMKLSDLLARGKDDGADGDQTKPFHKEGFASQAEEPEFHEGETEHAEPEAATPFWKREIGFGRRKDETEADPDFETTEEEPEKRPFFARTLGFGRTQDEAASDTDFDLDVVEKTPFWKRELAFGRRNDDATPDDVEEQPVEDDFAADADEQTPFWKRELAFGRRKDDATPEAFEQSEPADEDVFERDDAEKKPFWKRELAFGRRKDDESRALETAGEFEVSDHEEPEPEPVAAAVEPEPVEEIPLKNEVGDDHVDETTADAPAESEEPQFVEPERVVAFAGPEPVEETPSTDKPPFATAEAHDGDASVDEPGEAPFWKREIKFGRRRGDADLAPPASVPLPPSDAMDTLADVGAPSDREKKPFFKLTLGRTKDPDFDAPKPEKRPFFKRELKLRREKDGGHPSSAGRTGRSGRTKQLVGLKVGASQIAAARIVNNGSPELVQLARQSLEQGIVVGGELRDPDALAEALRDFFATHNFPNKNVRLGIGNNRIGVRSFEISGVHDPKQLENAIRFRAQEALPIPLDEAVLDYQVIEETSSPTGIRTYRVLLVVAYRELVDRYVAACRGAGLRLVGIDLEAFALLRALSPPPAEGLPEDTALVAVSIGHDRSTFAVSNGTVCEFTRVLDWGGASLNTSIARALDITPSQAEPVKRTLSLSEGEESTQAQPNEHTIRAEEAVRLELQSFARELVSSLHFYQNQPGSLAIGSITLTGGTAHLPGLAAELQRLIGVKVRVGDPLRRVKTAKRVETPAQVGSMAVAIGLGIED